MAWVFFLQRRDEQRHARLFDRIGEEVLGLPGDDAGRAARGGPRRTSRPRCSSSSRSGCRRWPPSSPRAAAGLGEGVSLYHMLLEGVVFDAGQHALLDDLADGALPGVREGVERVERDERWHVGFGLRCLIETEPSAELLDELLERADDAAAAWGDAVPPPRAKRARARSPTGCTSPSSSSGPRGVAAHAARRARTRAASSGPERRPSLQAAERTPAMSAPAARDHRQVLAAQRAGERHLQTCVVRVGHQRRERVGREPVAGARGRP